MALPKQAMFEAFARLEARTLDLQSDVVGSGRKLKRTVWIAVNQGARNLVCVNIEAVAMEECFFAWWKIRWVW